VCENLTPNQYSSALLQYFIRAQINSLVAKCMCSGKECQLLRRGGQTKQLEMPVTVLPNVQNEQMLFVMPYMKGDAMTKQSL
jgi:hypothetical protein